MRQRHANNGPVSKTLGIDQDALRRARILVDDEAYEIAIVLILGANARRERRLAAIAARSQVECNRLARLQIVFDEAGKQEPAGLCLGGINVAVRPAGEALICGAEFQDAVVETLLLGRAVI